MTDSTYTVVGAGAIGGTLAAHLHALGVPVQLVDADIHHVTAMRKNGLQIKTPSGVMVADVPVYGLDDAPDHLERVLLAVKAQATDSAAAWIAPRLGSDGYVASMQNGLNEATIAAHVGADRTVIAFVDLFADVLEPGVINDGGSGAMALGEYSGGTSDRVRQLAHDLRHWGSPTVTGNVAGFLWAKLGFGAMLTATALADADMSELIDRHRPAMNELAAEVFDVAAAEGISLEGFDAFDPASYVRGADPLKNSEATDDLIKWLSTQTKTRSGIWRDIAVRKRPTEVPTQYGPVIDMAAKHGLKLPLIEELVSAIRQLETGSISMDEEHLFALDRKAIAR
ncbi:2-dehydropantoate 2-reductase [Arthrobacter sp. SLBN-112]|jgi:2-dehydropantoate 2-reductase|uniref:ketopantoate reductase family protein n=1 Tax=Arthrobacter sp. SLBN-112 TaxID=2768452 RepID=UPI0011667D30|nr:2-dehydropantoate 2-reductase [Arthrobacter sp. SLBN-112]TQJ38461.1 2-dehydropantoate 2-reductase [Arthrobacter sp. SLBN-112]